MQCKNHPDREAVYYCTSCNAPLCSDCAEEVRPGVYACFQCAMLQTVSTVGSNIVERKERAAKKRTRKRKTWGAFQYFVVVCSVLILSMWGVIMFGGKPAPEQTTTTLDRSKAGRVLLFLVNGSIKRFAYHEGNKYPAHLRDLIPKYLQLKKNQLSFLENLRYARDPDPNIGYRLSLAQVKKGAMKITLTAAGVQYSLPAGEGS